MFPFDHVSISRSYELGSSYMQNFITFHSTAFGTDDAILMNTCMSYISHYTCISQIYEMLCYNDKFCGDINESLNKTSM